MSIRFVKNILIGSAATLGLMLACTAQAQPYDSDSYAKVWNYGAPSAADDYATDSAATVGGLTVYAIPRHERSFDGAPIDTLTASRVVPISDLDLSTGWGVHELHDRVERAAYAACNQLDNTLGYVPVSGDATADCQQDAVRRAMDDAPISYPPQ
jgi:UrcA family protein